MQANSPNHIQFQKYKEHFVVAYLIKTFIRTDLKFPNRYFSRRILSSRLVMAKKCTKKVCCTCKIVVLSIKPIPFCTVFQLPLQSLDLIRSPITWERRRAFLIVLNLTHNHFTHLQLMNLPLLLSRKKECNWWILA